MLENNTPKKTSNNQGDELLARITPRQAERFLVELANLLDDAAAVERFWKRYGNLLPKYGEDSWRIADVGEGFSDTELTFILALRTLIRNFWFAPDIRTREWQVFKILHELLADSPWVRIQEPWPEGAPEDLVVRFPGGTSRLIKKEVPLFPPPVTPFEQILRHTLAAADRARICAHFGCVARYFFAQRRNQKYCSDACAIPAKREAKRRWWREHGDAWRMERGKRKQKSPKRRRERGG
jgi:hypothetical protein